LLRQQDNKLCAQPPGRAQWTLVIIIPKMTKAQAVRIQRELVPGSGCVPTDEPFKTYGIWVLAFSHRGKGLTVFLTDRPIESEAEYEIAKEECGWAVYG
jgi:hypothetical protein